MGNINICVIAGRMWSLGAEGLGRDRETAQSPGNRIASDDFDGVRLRLQDLATLQSHTRWAVRLQRFAAESKKERFLVGLENLQGAVLLNKGQIDLRGALSGIVLKEELVRIEG